MGEPLTPVERHERMVLRLEPWLYRVVINVCRDASRRLRSPRLLALDEAPELKNAGDGTTALDDALAREEQTSHGALGRPCSPEGATTAGTEQPRDRHRPICSRAASKSNSSQVSPVVRFRRLNLQLIGSPIGFSGDPDVRDGQCVILAKLGSAAGKDGVLVLTARVMD